MTWHLQKITRFPNQVVCRWFLMNLTSGLITTNSAWTPPSVKLSKYASKLAPTSCRVEHCGSPSELCKLKLRFLEYGFKMICSGIRILMRSPRKPIKIVHSPAAQEVWVQWWWALVCLQMLCQTHCWICWCCLVFLYHCATEANFGTPAKTCMQNHLRTALHYM